MDVWLSICGSVVSGTRLILKQEEYLLGDMMVDPKIVGSITARNEGKNKEGKE